MTDSIMEKATVVASAYLSHNTVPHVDVPSVIASIYHTLTSLVRSAEACPPAPSPAVPIRKSVRPDEIVCLECGKGQKVLKRHIRSAHGLTADEYRTKWSLPFDYPVVAPNYAERRSQIAKETGLGAPRAKRGVA